jgi:hypothetical protein
MNPVRSHEHLCNMRNKIYIINKLISGNEHFVSVPYF